MRDTTPRPLSLAELLLKFGIAAERGDTATAEEARRELRDRLGVILRGPRQRMRRAAVQRTAARRRVPAVSIHDPVDAAQDLAAETAYEDARAAQRQDAADADTPSDPVRP